MVRQLVYILSAVLLVFAATSATTAQVPDRLPPPPDPADIGRERRSSVSRSRHVVAASVLGSTKLRTPRRQRLTMPST